METTEQILAAFQQQFDALASELRERLSELESKVNAPKPESKDMSKDDALRILNGDLKDKKHKDAAETLGLTYGQVYSCRLEFTFKDVHKELKAAGFKNPWAK